jgi:hypothetical protein
MTWDAARRRVVLFGGYDGRFWGGWADTWEWDGVIWVQRQTSIGPSGRLQHALTYDAARQRVVLFGGGDGIRSHADTWDWDGVVWTRHTPVASPAPRSLHAMAWDADRSRVVLYGGVDPFMGRLEDTWEWDSATWVRRNPTTTPGPRSSHSMVWDSARRRMVLFGLDTWLYGSLVPTATQAFGTACSGTSGRPSLTSGVPFLGNQNFALDLNSTRATAACIFLLAPDTQALQLGGGCTLYLKGSLMPFFAAANAAGFASVKLSIPFDPSLRGNIYAQGAVVDPVGPVAGLALSNGLRLAIGD